MSQQQSESDERHVQVWFGSHQIIEYVADPPTAAKYEAAISRRFAGLRVTNEPLTATEVRPPLQPLPSPRLWSLTPS